MHFDSQTVSLKRQLKFSYREKPCRTACPASVLNYCDGCPDDSCFYCQGICNCKKCHVICWQRENLRDFLNDISEFTFKDTVKQYLLELPMFIPMIGSTKMNLADSLSDFPIVAVRPKDLIVNGRLSASAQKGLHHFYNLHEKTKIVLVLSSLESQLEKIWKLHFSTNLIQELKDLNLYAILGPNFSVGQDHPRIMHLINMKRNNLMFGNFQQVGIPSIPDISWYDSRDFDRCVEWLKDNDIKTVSITVQCMIRDGKYLLKSLSKNLHDLEEGTKRPLRFVFIGANEAISEIISEFDNFSIITFQPFVKAFAGRKIFLRDGRMHNELNKLVSKEQLLFENVQFYKSHINKLYYDKVENRKRQQGLHGVRS